MLVFVNKNAKRILIVVGISALLVGIVVGVFLYLKSKDTSKEEQQPDNTQETIEQVTESTKQFFNEENKKIDEQAKSIEDIDDYKAVQSPQKIEIGLAAAQYAQESGDIELTNQILDIVMQENNALAIEAGQLCYQYATTEERKDFCVQRLTELARAQGIIGPNDTLPKSYYDRSGEDELG